MTNADQKFDKAPEETGSNPLASVEKRVGVIGKESATDPLPAIAGETDISARIEAIERRIEDQEASLRHVLGMLIEWLEEDEPREAA